MWTWEYDESGGYDCMTSAITIRRDGVAVATIDRADYDDVRSWGEVLPNDKMIDESEFIVKACNGYDTTRRLLKEALDAIELGFQFDDGDVYGMQHNDITDLAIEIEQILTV